VGPFLLPEFQMDSQNVCKTPPQNAKSALTSTYKICFSVWPS